LSDVDGAVLAAIAAVLSTSRAESQPRRVETQPAWTIAMRRPELSLEEIAALRRGTRR
jgi:hypothetical protein